jgi:hypothetical protein
MAGRIINPKWTERIIELERTGNPIDELSDNPLTSQWLIMFLSRKNTPFKVTNLGAGVKRITTITDECPMCKRKL